MGGQEKRLALDYDEVLEYVGQFGPFQVEPCNVTPIPSYRPVQRRVFLWLWLVSAAGGLAVVVFAFTGLEPRYRCRVSSCEVVNYT